MSRRSTRRATGAVMTAWSLLALLGCTGGREPAEHDLDLFLPEGRGAAPVVVLVPGGGWTSADPSGLVPLARVLADGGAVSATTTYRTASDDVSFPTPVEDVVCAAAEVVDAAEGQGRDRGPVVLLGHSAGGHLALLAGLRPEAFDARCSVEPSAVIGLAGAYDVGALSDIALPLFGVPRQDDPQRWPDGDPLRAAASRPEVPVLLVHGDADVLVPVEMTQRTAEALRDGGHDVDVVVLPGGDHASVFSPDAVADVVLDWLAEVDG